MSRHPLRGHVRPLRAASAVPLLILALPACLVSTPLARPLDPSDGGERLLFEQASPRDGDELPPPNPGSRADTIDFGFYEIRADGLPYAVRGGKWTFDHGSADSLEGWTSIDVTANTRDFWRHVTATIWTAEGNPPPWPQMNASDGIALCGASKPVADTLAWARGIGYGNEWCQRLTSPAFLYDGTGEVNLSFHYFNETEQDYDYSKVFVTVGSARTLLNPPGFSGPIGIDGLGSITQETYARTITNSELGGGVDPRAFCLVIEVKSDGGQSDEDGYEEFDTFYGAFGLDDVAVGSANLEPPVAQLFDFETSLQGWTPSPCPGIGSFFGIAPASSYNIQDPCDCGLSGNVLEMHDDTFRHPGDPDGQHEKIVSAICDRRGDIGDPAYLTYNRVLAEWDQSWELPESDGVFFRPVWTYYPYPNPHIPGLYQWSPPVGRQTFSYSGPDPVCGSYRNIATEWGIPPTIEKIKFIYELASSCSAFGIPPEDCSGETNFTPLLDNLRIRNVVVPNAPAIRFELGGRFQDGFAQEGLGTLSPYDKGNANSAYNLRMGSGQPAKLGDSLVVTGPVPGTISRWEAKLWLRLRRTGPGQSLVPLYNQWRTALFNAKGIDFYTGPNPLFTWGYMDSVEAGGPVAKHKFCSQFRDGPSSGGYDLSADLNYNWGGGGEQGEGNEILPDLCFTPGTKIEYFVTANFTCMPEGYYYIPDTLGRNYEEFEILPSYRLDGTQLRFPCFLYVDASGRSVDQKYVEAGLWKIYSGSSGPIPELRPWDRYDYQDAVSAWRSPLYRDVGGNSGATLYQLLGYKTILFDLGTHGQGATLPRDWEGLGTWLDSGLCASNNRIQGLYLSGTGISETIQYYRPSFLSGYLGATLLCPSYNAVGCPPGETSNDDNYCVRLGSAAAAQVPISIPTDLYGSWCPGAMDADVLGTTGGGLGNLQYRVVDSADSASFAQVVNDQLGAAAHYRTILSGFDLGHLAAPDPIAPGPSTECPHDSASVVTAITRHLDAALDWLVCGDFTGYPLCETPYCFGGGWPYESCATDVPPGQAPSVFVNSLERNGPNPFNPRTTIRFSLAQDAKATVVVYDVAGRTVRTLVDGLQKAGPHEVVWDGTDDGGRMSPSGVYWCRLATVGFTSNRKMVVLK